MKRSSAKVVRMPRRLDEWPPDERLRVLLETASLSEEELGAYLRREGLVEAQLAQWRGDALAGLAGKRAVVPSLSQTRARKRTRELERELRRKDKALAEAAALLVLQKKVRQALEGMDDDTAEDYEL